jgi:hypothetical protein
MDYGDRASKSTLDTKENRSRTDGDLVRLGTRHGHGMKPFDDLPSSSSAITIMLISDQTTTFAIQDLCLHPEYVKPLRAELAQGYEEFQRTNSGLPLLDSFIKESARLTPVESRKFSLPAQNVKTTISVPCKSYWVKRSPAY